jgi:hypothetical protein
VPELLISQDRLVGESVGQRFVQRDDVFRRAEQVLLEGLEPGARLCSMASLMPLSSPFFDQFLDVPRVEQDLDAGTRLPSGFFTSRCEMMQLQADRQVEEQAGRFSTGRS